MFPTNVWGSKNPPKAELHARLAASYITEMYATKRRGVREVDTFLVVHNIRPSTALFLTDIVLELNLRMFLWYHRQMVIIYDALVDLESVLVCIETDGVPAAKSGCMKFRCGR